MIIYIILIIFLYIIGNYDAIENMDSIIKKIKDHDTKKVYVIIINNKEYIWKYNEMINKNILDKHFNIKKNIIHKNIIPVTGLYMLDGKYGWLSPFKQNCEMVKYTKKKISGKKWIPIIDGISKLYKNNIKNYSCAPRNFLIDKNNNLFIIDYFENSVLDQVLNNNRKNAMLNTKINLIKTIYWTKTKSKPKIIDIVNNHKKFNLPCNVKNITFDQLKQWVLIL
jgi:hypothetical protein